MKKITIVTTTINIPIVLDSYISNIQKYNHENIEFIVIGDMKTPPKTREYLESISEYCKIDYWDTSKQKEWLKLFPQLDKLIPYNTIQRRNIGYLAAYEKGAEIIITIDDDNFAIPEMDFVGEYSSLGSTSLLKIVESTSDWFNPCDMLEIIPKRRIYHRGFPISKRWASEKYIYDNNVGRVVVNAGLWLGNPDIDASTRLEEPIETLSLKKEFEYKNIALAKDTWSPFNTQNMAFVRELIPCMYLPIMGDVVNGMPINRYDDIFSSYFSEKIIKHMGDFISFGKPLVRQNRNPHDYLRDLNGELPGMMLTDRLIESLGKISLEGKSYFDCYTELIENLRSEIMRSNVYNKIEKAFFLKLIEGMSVWIEVVEKLG